MIVRCANCQTEFSLDDQQVGPDGSPVRCSVCGYVFRVETPTAGGSDQPWQIRTVEELLFTAPDLATLRAWIGEGRLHPDDHVSRTGKHWVRLGDMPEFSDAFAEFSELPKVVQPVAKGPSETSAVDALGPPPAFGTGASEASGPAPGAPSAMPQSNTEQLAVALAESSGHGDLEKVAAEAAPKKMARTSSEGMVVGRVGLKTTARAVPKPPPAPGSTRSKTEAAPSFVPPPPPKTTQRYTVNADGGRSERATSPPGAPKPVAPEKSRGSMLGVVTSHVRPITQPVPEAKASAASAPPPDTKSAEAPAAPSKPPEVPGAVQAGTGTDPAEASVETLPRTKAKPIARAEPVHEVDDALRASGRGRLWPLAAGLGVLAGVAIVFGVPQIRARVLGNAAETTDAAAPDPEPGVDLGSADEALASADPLAIGRAEAELQARIDAGEGTDAQIALMKLAQVELLTTRALASSLRAAVDPAAHEQALADRQDDVARAVEIFGQVNTATVPDRDRIRTARARLRLVQGRPPEEILALLPKGTEELEHIVAGAPLWRDPSAGVPSGVIAGLRSLEKPTALAQLVLALAYVRSGDEKAAQGVADAVLEQSPRQPAAIAIRQGAFKAAAPTTGADDAAAATGGEEPATVPDEPAADSGEKPASDDGGKKPAVGGGASVGRLIDRGCELVDAGSASEGIALLDKAYAKRPKDLDVLVCLGLGHARKGSHSEALKYFERALDRNPRYGAALRGAARAAKKSGNTQKAVEYYQRVLKMEPRNSEAREYVQAHIGGGG